MFPVTSNLGGEFLLKKHRHKLAVLALACIWIWSSSAGTGSASSNALITDVDWSSQYGNDAASSMGRSVITTSDGGYIAAGEVVELDSYGYATEQKAYLVKIDSDGEIQWERKIPVDDPVNNQGSSAYQLIQSRDGGYLVSGITTDTSGKSRTVPYLVKLNNQGFIEWNKSYDDLSTYNHYYGESIAESPDGGYVITGYSSNSYGYAPAYLFKVDADGNRVWDKTFNLGENQYFNEVIATADGGYVAVGGIDSMLNSDSDASLVVKLSGEGLVEWEHQQPLTGSGRNARSVLPAEDGGYIVSGMLRQDQDQLAFVMKLNADGETLWEQNYNLGSSSDVISQLVATEDGYALIGRHSMGSYPSQRHQYQVIRLNTEGEQVDKLQLDNPGSKLIRIGKGTVAHDGGFVLTGQVQVNDKFRMQLVKFSVDGTVQPPAELSEIRFATNAAELDIGDQIPSVITAVYTDGSTTDISALSSFSSLNPEIAKVDTEGIITGLSMGSTTIIAYYGGLEARLSVQVLDAPSGPVPPVTGKFYLDSEDYSLSVDEYLDTVAWFQDAEGDLHRVNEAAEFSIDNENVAFIDQHGVISGISPGLTTLTAVYQGTSYSASVLVVRPYFPVQ